METQTKPSGAKDFFINLGAVVALYTVVVSLLNLLFTIINTAYPQITNGYNYYGSQSISWPVSILIIFFPIFILLMWILSKDYIVEPERKNHGVHKWLTYITLFISGLTLAGDLVTVLYYFIDGQELTTGFLLKILSVFVVTLAVFLYYISDIRGKLTEQSRMIWRIIAFVLVLGSIVWGFSVLGSPRNQQLIKYDEQKVNDLMNINQDVISYYQMKGFLPATISDLTSSNNYFVIPTDQQSGRPYEYTMTGQSARAYELCAEFNKASPDATQPNIYARPIGYTSWAHPVGHYCFSQGIDTSLWPKQAPIK